MQRMILCKLHSASREFQEWMHRLRCLVPNPSSSRSIHFGHSFAWTTWPETFWPRGIMRPRDSVCGWKPTVFTWYYFFFSILLNENFVAFLSASEMGERRSLKRIAAEWKRIKGGQEPEEALNNLPASYLLYYQEIIRDISDTISVLLHYVLTKSANKYLLQVSRTNPGQTWKVMAT